MGGLDAVSGGGNGPTRQFPKDLHRQKILLLRSWFQGLLGLCLLMLVVFLAFSDSIQPWFENVSLRRQFNELFSQRHHASAPAYLVHPKHRNILDNVEEHTTTSSVQPQGLRYHEAHPHNYRFIMDKAEVCKSDTLFLVLIVPVAPSNVAARDVVRQTWGKETNVHGKVVLTLFMLGLDGKVDVEKLKEEDQQHQDLIQSNFMDTYFNLTIKTMVIMDWLATRCSTAAYAMKVDSDMFLNIENLVIMLQTPQIPKENYLTGMLMWNRPVVRSKNSKWYVSEDLYPDPVYPTYTLGMGYVFSNDLPAKFVEISKSILPFNIEDAYIGMCMKKLGLSPTSPPNPSQFKAYNSKYDRCEFSVIITYILGSAEQLKTYWADYKKPGPHC